MNELILDQMLGTEELGHFTIMNWVMNDPIQYKNLRGTRVKADLTIELEGGYLYRN